jgi:hypothetical protein
MRTYEIYLKLAPKETPEVFLEPLNSYIAVVKRAGKLAWHQVRT